MCGRYSFSANKEKLKKQFGDQLKLEVELESSYNIAPTQQAYVILDSEPDTLQTLEWGLVPFWSKDGKNSGKLINARSESIFARPSFRRPIKNRRCLIIADSFYEWKRQGKQKTPYRIYLKDNSYLLFAGIWDVWEGDGIVKRTFSIITTNPNKEMAPIHNRMPIKLMGEEKDLWLTSESKQEHIQKMLITPPDGLLDYYMVSTQVNAVRNNSITLHNKINESPTLF